MKKPDMFDLLKSKIAEVIKSALDSAFDLNYDLLVIYSKLTSPPDIKMGHLAMPCFELAQALGISPVVIAEALASQIKCKMGITAANADGPYVNIYIDSDFLGHEIIQPILDGEYFKTQLTVSPSKIMVEFSQPNTHKELHVGHTRNMVLGDVYAKLLEYCGHEVIKATFPGDFGTHIAKCLWYLKYHFNGEYPQEDRGKWLGEIYSKAHNTLESKKGLVNTNEQLSEIMLQLHHESGEFYELWKETREWSRELFKKVYDWADIEFDKWYWESKVNQPSLETTRKFYEDGVFIKSEGAIGADLSQWDLGFFMLIKSDGHGLYSTKDIELALQKFKDYPQLDKSIYVVDVRQSRHFQQVFKTLELMGLDKAKDCYHFAYDFVELPEGPMAARHGNFVPLTDLIKEMEELSGNELQERYAANWTEEEINATAHKIAKAAIKYGMIRVDPKSKIVFDMDRWLTLQGETGPYLQYVYARINSLLKRHDYSRPKSVNWAALVDPREIALMLQLNKFNQVVKESCEKYAPHQFAKYLYDLSQIYNVFYTGISIMATEDVFLRKARLSLSESVQITLKKGLNLLGVDTLERM